MCRVLWKPVESVEGSVEFFHTSSEDIVELQLIV